MAAEELGQLKLSPATRIFHSLKYNSYIIAIIGFTTSLDPKVIKAGLEQTLIKHPRFSSKLVSLLIWLKQFYLVVSTMILNQDINILTCIDVHIYLLWYTIILIYSKKWFYSDISFPSYYWCNSILGVYVYCSL